MARIPLAGVRKHLPWQHVAPPPARPACRVAGRGPCRHSHTPPLRQPALVCLFGAALHAIHGIEVPQQKKSLCGRGPRAGLQGKGERGARLQLRDRAAECVACTAKRRCPAPAATLPYGMRPLGRWAAAPLLLAVVAACMRLPTSAAARTLAQAGPAAAAPAPAQAAGAGGSQEDAALLLAFKDSLENGAEVLNDWQPGSDPCAWTGISCKADGTIDSL